MRWVNANVPYDFTKRKFLELPKERQHKKCAECLKEVYHAHLAGKCCPSFISNYCQMAQWLGLPALSNTQPESLSNRYHEHLSQAEKSLKEHNLLPAVRKGDRKEPSAPLLPIAIYLDHIRSAHNVGSIIRTAECFSLGTLYFSSHTPFIDCKQVQNTSMGAHDWIPCKQNSTLESLPKPIIVLETTEHAIALDDFVFPSTFTLVIGNEEYGCSEESLALADFCLEIPLCGRKNSLNVANAFAIAAGAINRQQRTRSKGCIL